MTELVRTFLYHVDTNVTRGVQRTHAHYMDFYVRTSSGTFKDLNRYGNFVLLLPWSPSLCMKKIHGGPLKGIEGEKKRGATVR